MNATAVVAKRPPLVMLKQAPRPILLNRIAEAIELMIREMPICHPRIEATASQNAMITSDMPMHRDLMVVHGYPGAPTKLRMVSRVADLSISFDVEQRDDAGMDLLRCGHGEDAVPAALRTLEYARGTMRAAAEARTAYRPGTMRHDARRRTIDERLKAVGTMLIARDDDPAVPLVVSAPTPWSAMRTDRWGPVHARLSSWTRLGPTVSLSVLGVERGRNAWSIEISPVRTETSMDGDAMAVLRTLSELPERARRRMD